VGEVVSGKKVGEVGGGEGEEVRGEGVRGGENQTLNNNSNPNPKKRG